jgi:hypothetical protein
MRLVEFLLAVVARGPLHRNRDRHDLTIGDIGRQFETGKPSPVVASPVEVGKPKSWMGRLRGVFLERMAILQFEE